MASLYNNKISTTYVGLIKTVDNAVINASLKELTDGSGNATGLFVNTAGDFKVTSILEFGSLKDTGEGITITKFVDEADGIASNDNDTTIPTSAAVVDYVASRITLEDLDFIGDTGNGSVDLDSEAFTVVGTTNEIDTIASNQTLQIGIVTNPIFSGNIQVNGLIKGNNDIIIKDTSDNTLAAFYSGGKGEIYFNNSKKFETTSDGATVTGGLTATGTSVFTAATFSGTITGDVTGDLTGNVTATSVLADGVTATTQSASDNSTKVATTAYVETAVDTVDTLAEILVIGNTTGATKIEVDNTSSGVDFIDNAKARFGTGNDLEIYHDGSSSYITDAGTGDLVITASNDLWIQTGTGTAINTNDSGSVDLYYDNSKKFETSSTGATVTGNLDVTGTITGVGGSFLPLAGGTMTGNTINNDNVKSIYGTASDGLEIYHDGSNSYIQDVGTGNLFIDGANNVQIRSATDSAVMASFSVGGAASLYFGGSSKIDTSSTGVSVTGNIVLTGDTITNNNQYYESKTTGGGSVRLIGIDNSDNIYIGSIDSGADNVYIRSAGTNAISIDSSQDVSLEGSLTIAQDLTVNGTTTTVNTDHFNVEDPLISMAKDNAANTVDIGYYGRYNDGTQRYLGLFSDASDSNVWKLFKGLTVEPTTTVDTTATGYALADLDVAGLSATNVVLTDLLLGSGEFLSWGTEGVTAIEGSTVSNKLSFRTQSTERLLLNSTGATFAGDVSLTAGSISISGDGSNAATLTESSAGILTIASVDDLTLDCGSDISLDTGGNDIRFKKSGVEYGKFKNDSGNFAIYSSITDEDIIFRGDDGGSLIDALTLDMSNGGSATFRDDIDFGGKLTQTGTGANTFAGNVDIYQATDSQLQIESLNEDATLIINSGADGVGGANREEGFIKFYQDNADHFTLGKKNNGQFSLYDHAGGQDVIIFQDNGGILLTPSNNLTQITGKLGIGTVASRQLDVRDSSDTQNTILAYNQGASFTGTVYEAITDRTSNSAFNLMNLKASTVSKFLVRGDGNVGIGTDSPQVALQIGTHLTTAPADTGLCVSNRKSIRINDTDGSYNFGVYMKQNYSGSSYLILGTRHNAIDTDALFVKSGNVGIGTDSPDTRLEVEVNDGTAITRTTMNAADGYRGGFEASNTHTGGSIWSMFSTNDSDGYFGGGKFAIGNETMADVDASTPALVVIDGTGNVGIGIEDPEQKLSVAGKIELRSGNWLILRNSDNSNYGSIRGASDTSNDVTINTNSEVVRFKQNLDSIFSGNVIIHNTSNAPYIDFVESGATTDSKARITMDQVDTDNASLLFSTEGAGTLTTRMTINKDGQVGIGTAPEVGTLLHLEKNAAASTVVELLRLDCGENSHASSKGGAIVFRDINVYTDTAKIIAQRIGLGGGSTLQFSLRGTELMRITSNGDIDISGNSYVSGNKAKQFESNPNTVDLKSSSSGTGLEYHQEFANPNGTVGSITSNASATAFNTSSDYRLKEDLKDFNGLDKVSKIPVYDFKWKVDENRSYGVMAHELEEVLPQAVSGEKDAEKMQSVDYSKIVPLLVKSIQELKAEIDELKKK